jgi:hypothetical protein
MTKGKPKDRSNRGALRFRSENNNSSGRKSNATFTQSTQLITCSVVLIVIGSVSLHIYIALDKENWWQLHADEIYQSLEGEQPAFAGSGRGTTRFKFSSLDLQ